MHHPACAAGLVAAKVSEEIKNRLSGELRFLALLFGFGRSFG
jgi:hypothetical protein